VPPQRPASAARGAGRAGRQPLAVGRWRALGCTSGDPADPKNLLLLQPPDMLF
jgi:hypothetical protein